MSITDPEKRRTYYRERARRKAMENRGGLPSPRSVNYKFLTPEERKLKKRASQKRCREKYRIKMRLKIDNLLGATCILCNSHNSLHNKLNCHRKDGTSHYTNSYETVKEVIRNPNEFVRVCRYCHNGVHWMMKTFKMSWDKILRIKIEHP